MGPWLPLQIKTAADCWSSHLAVCVYGNALLAAADVADARQHHLEGELAHQGRPQAQHGIGGLRGRVGGVQEENPPTKQSDLFGFPRYARMATMQGARLAIGAKSCCKTPMSLIFNTATNRN